jgi:hypothetical protein
VDKNYLIKLWGREGDITRLMLIQIKQILFLDGAQSSLEEAMASAWKWEQKVRKAE